MAPRKRQGKTSSKRNHKKQRPNSADAKPPIPGWLILLSGVLIGLGSATFLFIFKQPPNQQLGDLETRTDRLAHIGIANEAELNSPEDNDVIENVIDDSFDFYTLLTEQEVIIPESELRQRLEEKEARLIAKGHYLLQAGSFRSENDAETLKAQLAFLGVIADVQKADTPKGVFHRVRIGPFDSSRAMDIIRRRLVDNNIQPLIMQIKK